MELKESYLYRDPTPEWTDVDAYLPDVGDVMHYANLGDDALVAGDLHTALGWYERALAVDPRDEYCESKRVAILRSWGEIDDHDEDDDEDADALILTGNAASSLRMGRPSDAVWDCDKALRLGFKDVRVYLIRGDALLELGEFRRAEAAYSSAISLEPSRVMTYVKRGAARLHLRKIRSALKDFSMARDLTDDHPQVRDEIMKEVVAWSGKR